jgi:hypothetical protein
MLQLNMMNSLNKKIINKSFSITTDASFLMAKVISTVSKKLKVTTSTWRFWWQNEQTLKCTCKSAFNLVVESVKKNNMNLCIGFVGLVGLVGLIGLYFVLTSFNELVLLFGKNKVKGLVFFNVFLLFFDVVFTYVRIYRATFFVNDKNTVTTNEAKFINIKRLILFFMVLFWGIMLYYVTNMVFDDVLMAHFTKQLMHHQYKFTYCCNQQLGGTFVDYNLLNNKSVIYKFYTPHSCSVVTLQQSVEPHGTFNLHNFIKQCIYSEVPVDPKIFKFKELLSNSRHDQAVLLAQGKAQMIMDQMQALATNTAVEQAQALSQNTVVEAQATVPKSTVSIAPAEKVEHLQAVVVAPEAQVDYVQICEPRAEVEQIQSRVVETQTSPVVEPAHAPAVVEQVQSRVVEAQAPVRRTPAEIYSELRAKLLVARRIEAAPVSLEAYLADQKLAASQGNLTPWKYQRLLDFCQDLDNMSTPEEKIKRYKYELKFIRRFGHIIEQDLLYDVPEVASIEKEKELSTTSAIAAPRGS